MRVPAARPQRGPALAALSTLSALPSLPALPTAVAAAIVLCLVLRGDASGWLAPLGGALLSIALRRAEDPLGAAIVAATCALGVTSVAAVAIAPLTPVGYAAAALVLAIPFALVGIAHHVLLRIAPRWADLAAALSWPGIEALLGQPALFGWWAMPVVSLAYGLVDTPFLPLAVLIGVPGLSFLVLASGAALARLGRRPLATPLALATLAAAGMAAPVALVAPTVSSPSLPIRIVQPGLRAQEIAAARLDGATADEHATALATASRGTERLVVWPEGVLPAPIELPLRAGRPAALPADAVVLLGAATRRGGDTFNSALIWRHGRLDLVADKRRLVPLTEASLTPGTDRPPLAWAGSRLGVLICWEAAFPGLARRSAAAGADVLVVLADDAYAPAGPVGELHLRVARLRAAATGLPLVFASQAGPSATVDGRGRVIERLEQGVAGVLDVELPLATFATRRPLRGSREGDASVRHPPGAARAEQLRLRHGAEGR